MRAELRSTVFIVVLAVIALAMSAAQAQAQWSVTGVGVAEYDTNETLLLLAGVSASPWGGPGVAPVFGVQGYRLSFPRPAGGTTVIWSVRPSAGLRNNFRGGSGQLRIGYAFTSREVTDAPPTTVVADPKDGVVLSGQLDWWGTGGPLGAQLLASYNFGASTLWTRGRITTRIAQTGPGQVRVGGEVAYYRSDDFRAVQPGGVLEWHTGGGTILAFGVGRKLNDPGDDATYFRTEIVLPLLRP